jgi:hypothetical protein
MLWVTWMNSMPNGPRVISSRALTFFRNRSVGRPCSWSLRAASPSVKSLPYTGTRAFSNSQGSAPMWSSWPCVRRIPRTSPSRSVMYVMSGMTKLIPRACSSGNMSPASTTIRSEP